MVNPRGPASLPLANIGCAERPRGSRTHLQAALDLKPTDAHFFFKLAEFYEQRLQQRDRALKALTEAVSRGQTWRGWTAHRCWPNCAATRFQSLRHPL
jgi:thioredoxin-like negative regulator of GroEL